MELAVSFFCRATSPTTVVWVLEAEVEMFWVAGWVSVAATAGVPPKMVPSYCW